MSGRILGIDPGMTGAWAALSERADILASFDLPTIGEGTQRRIDAANLADAIREHTPYSFAIVEQVSARPGNGIADASWAAPPRRGGGAHGDLV